MQAVTTIGLDIAKSVFQVHGVNAEGHVVLRRQLKRRYAGMSPIVCDIGPRRNALPILTN
jgi:transposase